MNTMEQEDEHKKMHCVSPYLPMSSCGSGSDVITIKSAHKPEDQARVSDNFFLG